MKEKLFCKICGKELQGSQRLYCSSSCKQKGHYQDIKNNTNTSHSQYIRAWRRKLKLLDIFGSHCEICGYNKNIAALEFHHKDSTQKEFKLDARKLANTKWENILIEAKKCQLLCSNCHRELHNPEMESNLIKDKLKIMSHKELQHASKLCSICGKQIPDYKTYCSKNCWLQELDNRYKSKNYPTKDEIIEKYQELKSWEKVARFYNLTRKILQGIRKKS